VTPKLATALRRVRTRHPELLSAEQFAALLRAVVAECGPEPETRTAAFGGVKTREEWLAAEAAWWA